ncbi:efflux RND transporter periplasmic adaptor subunit [Chryseolinea sp. T2]|uniref:efflux RND transporter periplasmic adaptor subunit n=1 Tax=Chryseolinea sp. T2 TaxID=3129255 RepID=UPI0030774513
MRRSSSYNDMNSLAGKLISYARIGTFVLIVGLLFAACRKEAASNDVYTCPMHPTIVSNKPGACPVCNMELVKKVPGAEVVMDEELSAAAASPDEMVLSSVKTVKGEFTAHPVSYSRTGVVTYDARNRSIVSARVSGRLEKVYVRYIYQRVRKGDRVADIYSPDLVAAQRELLQVHRSDPDNERLLDASKQRLRNMGMTAKQIDEVIARNDPQYKVTLYSPADGVVVQRGSQAPSAPSGPADQSTGMNYEDAMNASQPPTQTPSSPTNTIELPREGTYVSAGQSLFEVISFNSLAIEINLPPTASGSVRRGDELNITSNNTNLNVTVDLVQPYVEAGELLIKVRAYVRGGDPLTIGQLVTAKLEIPAAEGLWLPASAVYDLGIRKVVFKKQGRHFIPVEVETGASTGQEIMIISGVASAEEIAAQAQFLIDNEGFIKTR